MKTHRTTPLHVRSLTAAEIGTVRSRLQSGPDGQSDELLELLLVGAVGPGSPACVQDCVEVIAAMSLVDLEELVAALCPDDEPPPIVTLASARESIRGRALDQRRRDLSAGGRRC